MRDKERNQWSGPQLRCRSSGFADVGREILSAVTIAVITSVASGKRPRSRDHPWFDRRNDQVLDGPSTRYGQLSGASFGR